MLKMNGFTLNTAFRTVFKPKKHGEKYHDAF